MQDPSGVSYTRVDSRYFEKRGLRRYAGVWSLWALGVGGLISGHFSGWNVGPTFSLAVMFVLWFSLGADQGATVIGGALLNMAVFGAMVSYIMQALSFIKLRSKFPALHRPYRSTFGVPGATATIVIAAVTLYFQLTDPVYRQGVSWVAVWFAVGVLYFAVVARKKLILSPEEEFAMEHAAKAR